MSLSCVCNINQRENPYNGAVDISEINVGQPIFGIEKVNGKDTAIFHINYIKLIDQYFTAKWLSKKINPLTIEQERFLNRYLYECSFVTSNGDDKYEYMDRTLKFLDRILGTYGVLNETSTV